MIVNERLTQYFDSIEPGNSPLLETIREEALRGEVPIIKRDTESLLKTMISIRKPLYILEVGTAVAYSTLIMSEAAADAHIVTIEKYAPRIPIAKANILRANAADKITLVEEDATVALEELNKNKAKFDFVFMDAAKGQYLNWLPLVFNLMNEGAVLLSDNVLQEGTIVESRYAIDRRNRTIHSRMREYLYTIKHMKEFSTSILPVGDGVALCVKLK